MSTATRNARRIHHTQCPTHSPTQCTYGRTYGLTDVNHSQSPVSPNASHAKRHPESMPPTPASRPLRATAPGETTHDPNPLLPNRPPHTPPPRHTPNPLVHPMRTSPMTRVACQSRMNASSQLDSYPCQRPATTRVTVGCVHEHQFDADLCDMHTAEVETSARCIHCGDRLDLGDLAHRCPLITLAAVPLAALEPAS